MMNEPVACCQPCMLCEATEARLISMTDRENGFLRTVIPFRRQGDQRCRDCRRDVPAGTGERRNMETERVICRLCQSREGLQPVGGLDERRYFLCDRCGLIGVSAVHFPGRQEERSRYLTHQNGIEHQGYVSFLRRAIDPALAFLTAGMTGLDYGCGPVPTLSALLRREGIGCEDYDPFFVDHPLQKTFDFVFSTEAFEHFFHPGREIRKIRALLREKGLLIVMTQQWKDLAHFSQWHYARDPTHVSFYHARTFDFLCRAFGFSRIFDDGDRVVILRKEDKPWMNSPLNRFKS